MDLKSLIKIKRKLREMYASPQGRKANDFIPIARQLGRKLDSRGKEPNYVRESDPALTPPLSIPNHSSKDFKVGTARSIINALLEDVDDWEIFLQSENDENSGNDDTN